jgi:phosphoadenosine phosphosulfate reductase
MKQKKTTADYDFDIVQIAHQFETRSPYEILQWGGEKFGQSIVLACSFGPEDLVLLDMLMQVDNSAKVFYLDTDKHFRETYITRDRLVERYNIDFIQMKADITLEEQANQYGEKLWETNPDLCCNIRKVKPLQRVLNSNKAWITGIRREQAATRANAKKVEWDTKFELIKLNPLASWTNEDVWNYIRNHQIPYNPLHDQNYPSIGCDVCTRPVKNGENSRAGRWGGLEKTECGLHK